MNNSNPQPETASASQNPRSHKAITRNELDKINERLREDLVLMRFNRDKVLASLIECRDILCALQSSDASIKLAYLLPKDIPSAIRNGYDAIQEAAQ